jgi:hypothetical protein
MAAMDGKRELLRHGVATVAYRAARALEDAPEEFAEFGGCDRTPAQILAHMGDLFDWALSMARGEARWHNSTPLPWGNEKARFFAALAAFDEALAAPGAIEATEEVLLQAPVADALTHVGQLAMMRRLAGSPAWSENFAVARIEAGRAGADQAPAVKRFR